MNNLETRLVRAIQQLKGKSGKYFTSTMKKWGGGEEGSMVDGLLNIVNLMSEDKRLKVNQTRVTYGVGGLIGGAAAIGFGWWYTNHKERVRHNQNCNKMVKIVETEVEAAKSEEKQVDLANKES